MKIIPLHRALVAFAVAGLAVAAAQADPGVPETTWGWHPKPAVGEAVPPLPPPSTYPVQLVLDDDTSDGAFGVAGQTARQFLWFNRFTPAAGFHLEQVWVLFPSGANMAVGGAVQIAIYEDPDGDPTNGANLIASFNETIQAADDNTFSIYGVAGSPVIPGGSDLLVGVVPRFIVSGVTPPTFPAAVDTTATQSRSWVAAWTADPPDPPVLVPLPDQTLALVDTFLPGGGNFMIRAFGTSQSVVEIPTLGGIGIAALALALLAAGAVFLRRRRVAAALTLSLLFFALALPAGAITIDTFTTAQASISDPPGTATSVTGAAADPIGSTRGLFIDLLSGAGPTTVGVAGGVLNFSVTGTTPDSRGKAVVTWDGDSNPNVLDPIGLPAVDLTASGHSGFRILVNSATVGTELELDVYTSTEHSSVARRLPAIASPTSIFIPFDEFRDAVGAGASFAEVGAIVMTIRGTEVTAAIDLIETSAPTVAATKVDTINVVDVDGDGRVDPGDRLRYTVTVTNTGNQALAANLTDTISGNTTLVAGTVSSTPVAHNDQYGWFGNVTLNADGTPFPTLLANDADADGDDVDVQSVVSPTAAGGTVALNDPETGEFTYTPPAGFKGVDSFSYTINDGESHTATATAYINLEGIVWFVDNVCTVGCGAGTQSSPFQTLPAAETPSGANDIIYVLTGTGPYDTGPANGFTMDEDEQLLGQGVALVLGGTTIIPAGSPPTLTNNDGTPGRGLTLAGTGAGTDTVRGLTIGVTGAAKIFGSAFGTFASDTVTLNGNGQALHLVNGVLVSTFASITSGSSALTGITLQQVSGLLAATGGTSITDPTNQGILVDQSTASVSFGTTSVTGTGTDRVSLQNNSTGTRTFGSLTTTGGSGAGLLHAVGGGTTTVTGATSITNPAGIGISIASSTSAVTFASTTINKGSTSGTGLSIAGGSGTTSFSNLAVTTSNGTGILASTCPLTIGGTGSTVAATGGPALDLTTVNLGTGATFLTASSTGSAGKGMNLDTLTGSLTMNGGSIGTPAGIAFDLNAGSANVTYAGGISNVANALLVDITGRTGGTVNLSGNLSSITLGDGINVASNTGGTINFSGAIKTLTTGAAAAVTLATNTGATINFTGGGLAITTTSGAGFNATGGATALTVQGTVNTITSTTGTALNVANSTIGASGLTFQSISVTGNGTSPASGIVLNTTGSGGLTITGTGGANSGGVIQGTGSHGMSLTTASAIELNRVSIHDTGDHGIFGDGVNGFTLRDSTIFDFGNTAGAGVSEDAMHFESTNPANTAAGHGLTGTVTIQRSTIGPDSAFALTPNPPLPENKGIVIRNHNDSQLILNVTGTTFTQLSNDGIDAEVSWNSGSAPPAPAGTINVDGSTGDGVNTFSQINGRAVNFQNPVDNAQAITLELTMKNNSLDHIGIGGRWAASGRCTVNARYNNNAMTFTYNDAIRSESDAINAALTPHASVNATVSNNTMGGGSIFISLHRGALSNIAFTNNTNLGGTAAGSGGCAACTGVHTGINLRSDRGSALGIDFTGNVGTADGSLAFAQSALDLQTTNNGGGNSTICANIGGAGALKNTLTENPDTAGQQVISLDPVGGNITIEGGPGGSPGTENFLIANNTLNGVTKVAISNPAAIPSGVAVNCVTSTP